MRVAGAISRPAAQEIGYAEAFQSRKAARSGCAVPFTTRTNSCLRSPGDKRSFLIPAASWWRFVPIGKQHLKSSTQMATSRRFVEDADMDRILFSEDAILEKVRELGSTISADYEGRHLSVIGVATGAFMFLADLVRSVSIPLEVDIIRAASYGGATMESSGTVDLKWDLKNSITGRHVIVVEDILDTGRTLDRLINHLELQKPASVSVCVLLDKVERREVPLRVSSGGKQYTGFECPNLFVVGYGLDFNEKYRSLPYVGVLKPHFYGA